jgi:epoxyqueuosine reductase QueG
MAAPDNNALSLLIREKAYSLGFDLCGIAPSRPLEEHEPIVKNWCSSGMASDMTYLCRNLD